MAKRPRIADLPKTDVGTVDFNDYMAALPADERAEIEARAAVLLAEHATLEDLRRAYRKTQTDLAKKLGVGQDAISRLEKRSDMLLSTLRSYVAALGGELSLVATFPDRPPVKIETLDWITPDQEGPDREQGEDEMARGRKKAAAHDVTRTKRSRKASR